jgi:hypothetical protein
MSHYVASQLQVYIPKTGFFQHIATVASFYDNPTQGVCFVLSWEELHGYLMLSVGFRVTASMFCSGVEDMIIHIRHSVGIRVRLVKL